MYKVCIVLFFLICLPFSMTSQEKVTLMITFKTDTLSKRQQLEFSSFDEAEASLHFKLDSLSKQGFPFLNESREIKEQKLLVTIQLHQKIEFVRLHVEDNYSQLLPPGIKFENNKAIVPYPELSALMDYVLMRLKDEGLPFTKISLSNIELYDQNTIEADLGIETGQKRRIDKVNIKGYPELSQTYVSRFSNLKPGKVFIESEIQSKTEKLNNIPFINVKKPTEVLFKKDSTELFVYLEKISSNSFDGFLGFGNSDNDNFQLNGYLNMVLLNNLNFGERLGIVYKNDGFGQQTFEGNVNLPFLFKSPVSLEAGLRIFRRDSSFSNSSQLLDLNYQLNEKFSLQGGLEFTTSTNIEPENLIQTPEVVDFNSTFYGLGFHYLDLKSREGFNEDSFLSVKASLGRRESQLDSDQYKLVLKGQHQISLNFRNKIFLNLNSQLLISENYLNNELFRFGGVNSIRGFAENSLIADRFAVLQTEYRYLLDSNLFANSVVDLGNYNNRLENFSENILGYGVGLGLKSKAGIFRLVLANALSNRQEASFTNSKIHISFTSFF